MKKILVSLIFFTLAVISKAQETGSSSRRYQYQNVRVKAMVLDAKSSQPIPYVTVYLIPQGDTTITNFSVSSENGQVVLDKVASGKYELNAELLGYNTFTKVYDIYQAPGWDLDLGTIGMEESTESIDAASITAAGNPITIQKDTVIYNASSFRVGENAMLEDLLKKMPGIQVNEDGTATVNGEKVDRITVGGKTFFFGDPSMALKNIPAKIVERIKVSRQESKSTQMGGISTELTKETVMDVELKEEYQEGWFGDARLAAGATLGGNESNPFTQGTKFLYDGSAMASIYGKKDQAVFIGNAYNIETPGSSAGSTNISGLPEDDYTDLGGLTTAIKGGVNYNTNRIKNFETTISANYRHVTKDDRKRTSRTSFVTGGDDLLTEGGTDAFGKEDQFLVNIELSKQQGSLLVDFTPRFYFRKSSVSSTNFSDTYYAGTASPFNTSSASSLSDNKQFLSSGTFGLTGTQLGKAGRRVGFNLDYSAGASNGNKLENSLQTLNYGILGKKLDLDGEVFYYEPLSPRWGLEATISNIYQSNLSDRGAFNADGSANDYFTNKTNHRFLQEGASLLTQFSNDTSTVKFGITAAAYNDLMDATMLGINTVIGKGYWRFRLSPIAMYSYSKDGHDLSLSFSSYTSPVSGRQMIPVPDISNPVQITVGNTYLKSGIGNSISAYYNMVNYTTYTFLTLYATAELETNGTVYASWFDNTGARYAVPVNARKPGTTAMVSGMLNQPFGKMKNFTLTVAAMANLNNRYGYQAQTLQQGLDLTGFDYKTFMDGFWGNESGDHFYSGQSGFAESRTTSIDWGFGVDLKYNRDFFTGKVDFNLMNGRATYSLNPATNMNIWEYNYSVDLLFQLDNDWEIGTDARHRFFRGYSPGYGKPELDWNLSVSKTIKSVTLSLKCNDILNQERSLTRTVASEYVEDSYRNVMGRTILFGISFNFGKLNSNKTSAVSSSIKRLEY